MHRAQAMQSPAATPAHPAAQASAQQSLMPEYVQPKFKKKRGSVLRVAVKTLLAGTTLVWVGALATQFLPKEFARFTVSASAITTLSQVAAPLALLAVCWMLFSKRNGTMPDEEVAQLIEHLDNEQKLLHSYLSQSESRLMSGARALSHQGQQLDAVAEATVSRIGTLRAMLGEEIAQIGLHTNALKNAAAAARSDMAVLMANLPKAQNETRQVAMALKEATAIANESAEHLHQNLHALASGSAQVSLEAGVAAQTVAHHVDSAQVQFERMNGLLREVNGAFVQNSSAQISDIEHRIAEANQHMMLIHQALADRNIVSEDMFRKLNVSLNEVEQRLAFIDRNGIAQTSHLLDKVTSLTHMYHNLQGSLHNGNASAEELVSKSEHLVVALDASAREIEHILPRIITKVEEHSQEAFARIAQSALDAEQLEGRVANTNQMLQQGQDMLLVQAQHLQQRNAIAQGFNDHMHETSRVTQNMVATTAQASEALRQQAEMVAQTGQNVAQSLQKSQEALNAKQRESMSHQLNTLLRTLHNMSIDVTRIMSHDVSDKDWRAFMNGDTGFFTRRAVKLVNNTDARLIVHNYKNQAQFRETVDAFITEFEQVLRATTASEEGGVLLPTLLSSDMGKIYVSLAQAVERLPSKA